MDIDVNKMAAEFVQANLESAVQLASSKLKTTKAILRSKLEGTYRVYLTRLLDRYSRGKSFFIRSEPVPLYEFFVPLDLSTERRVLRRPGAVDVAEVSTAVIVTGSGGSGKTMIMRHLLISAIESRAKTPVFYELRQQNQQQEPLRVSALRSLQSFGLEVDDEYMERALEGGHFCIMLDGFDELAYAHRRVVAAEIQKMAQRYPRNWFILSSRPDPQLQGWDGFVQLQIQPLDLEGAVELVQKLPFENPVKDRFVADLDAGLFARHKSFLSNPLLLSIMLLTYSDVAHIPTKLSVFYTQAYESLFQKHDALKGGFQRERRSGLDIQDFAKAFAAFCVQSYDQRAFSFPPTRALEFFEGARQITHLTYDSEAILHDSIQAVCLLLEEGVDVTFAHRSFQEYFVAKFISACPAAVKGQLIRRFAPSVESDKVVSLLHELDPYAVEEEYVLPALEGLRRRVKFVRSVGITHFLRYLKSVWRTFHIPVDADGGVGATLADFSLYAAMQFVYDRYGRDVRPERADGFHLDPGEWNARFEEEFGRGAMVNTREFTTRTPIVRFLYDRGGIWGAQFLRDVLSAEDLIRRRHLETDRSLGRLLKGTAAAAYMMQGVPRGLHGRR